MSDQTNGQMKKTERIVRPQGGPGPMGAGGAVGDKAMNFVPSAKRLLRRMAPYKLHAYATIGLAAVSVTLMSLGPWLLGKATNIIFGGVFSRQLPAGVTQEEAVEGLRAQGDDKLADMLSGMEYVTPGQGVDFDALRSALLVVLAVYLVASLLSFVQGWILNSVVQGTVKGLREDVEKKVHSVPLSYFDKQPRGELLINRLRNPNPSPRKPRPPRRPPPKLLLLKKPPRPLKPPPKLLPRLKKLRLLKKLLRPPTPKRPKANLKTAHPGCRRGERSFGTRSWATSRKIYFLSPRSGALTASAAN